MLNAANEMNHIKLSVWVLAEEIMKSIELIGILLFHTFHIYKMSYSHNGPQRKGIQNGY